MGSKEYYVELIGRQRSVYTVRARDADSARRIAVDRWRAQDGGDLEGFSWAELENSRVIESSGIPYENQDDELILRFIRERENLLVRLGGLVFSATMNDAISANQAASDLGWYIASSSVDRPVVDVLRAALALERLCSASRLVCFDRTRGRSGERGEIRLYCTPEYLESLTETIPGITVHARS